LALIGVGAVGMGRRLAKSSAREQALPRSSFSRRTPCHVLAFIGPPKEFPCRSIGLQLLPEFLDFCAEECPERSSTNKQASPAWTDVHNFLARPKKVYLDTLSVYVQVLRCRICELDRCGAPHTAVSRALSSH
jgi:hypothetical protein